MAVHLGKFLSTKKIDDIDITWDRVGYESNFKTIDQKLQKVVHGLGGTYVRNPMWSETLGKGVIPVHPLDGCSMGESGRINNNLVLTQSLRVIFI